MTTIGQLVDSVFRRYLEPPDGQPATSRFATALPIGDTSFKIGRFDIREDEELLRQGSVIEAGSELMRVTSYNDNGKLVTVLRAQFGTEQENHAIDDQIKLSPPYPRSEVLAAVGQNVTSLYPRLWTVTTEVLGSAGQGVYPLDDDLAVEVIEVYESAGGPKIHNHHGRIISTHPRTGGRALQLNNCTLSSVWARYRRRMAVPTSEAQTLEDVGVDEVWANVVMVGAAADILAGRDITAAHVEWVGGVLQAENIPVGTRGQIALSLARYRELLIDRFAKEMAAEDSNSIVVQMSDPFQQVV